MPREPWFIESFSTCAMTSPRATAAGRRLVIAWELRGCPPCIELHRLTLSNPEVAAFLPAHFDIVALDFAGAREVTFPDGTIAPEKAMSRRQRIAGPPTFQIFDPTGREARRIEGFAPRPPSSPSSAPPPARHDRRGRAPRPAGPHAPRPATPAPSSKPSPTKPAFSCSA
jgi:thiol-disulfide isomerase/thioredoxin